MSEIFPLINLHCDRRCRAAIFLSGSGTNAEKIIENWKIKYHNYDIVLLFTDRPESSRARQLANKYNLDVIENDIKEFYRDQGLKRVSIATVEGRQVREQWTQSIREQLRPYKLDFAIFAGFVPLTNITGDFPCLNVHPGDLTYLKNGSRYLVGLHTIPIERAILEGLAELRTSVILARPYDDDSSKMDSGPILGLSDRVEIDLQGCTRRELISAMNSRPPQRPRGGYGDDLERIAAFNLDQLKRHGDWSVFPAVVNEFALGRYAVDKNDNLFYREDSSWIEIKTLIFGNDGVEIIRR